MRIRRVITLCVALASIGTASPTLFAQNNEQQREQPKRSRQEQQDVDMLVKTMDGVVAGSQAAPVDVPITWVANHFTRSANGTTYVPFILTVDRSKLSNPGVAFYVRVVSKDPAPTPTPATAPASGDRNAPPAPPTHPWEDLFFVNVPNDGKIQRAMAIPPGNYEVMILAKERTPERQQRNAPPQKVGLLRHAVTVPNFDGPDLQTSTVIVANQLEPLTQPLNPTQQQEQPYSFGALRVVPSVDAKIKKSAELQVIFWVYGAGNQAGKPNLTIEYAFHQKTGDTEKYFNRTAPQELSAQTLPPEFDTNAGHQLTGSVVVPVASFPEGDYRLEIKITDKISGKTLTQNANFAVVAG